MHGSVCVHCMCVCVCMCVCEYVCIACVCVCVHCMCVYVCVCVHCTCVHGSVGVYACITHEYTHVGEERCPPTLQKCQSILCTEVSMDDNRVLNISLK